MGCTRSGEKQEESEAIDAAPIVHNMCIVGLERKISLDSPYSPFSLTWMPTHSLSAPGALLEHILQLNVIWKLSSSLIPRTLCDVSQSTINMTIETFTSKAHSYPN